MAQAADPSDGKDIDFTDMSEAAGLIEPLKGLMGHGAAWGDFDQDGDPDLFVGGFSDRPDDEYAPASGPAPNRLLRNDNGRFERVIDPLIETHARTSGAAFADFDNDGGLELYVANNAKQRADRGAALQMAAKTARSQFLAFDRARKQFIDLSKRSGACPDSLLTARNVVPLDYDLDGRLDLFVVEDRFTPKPRSRLLRNVGDLRFEDVTTAVGLPADVFGLGCAVADLNGDRRPDIFVAHSNRLFVSASTERYREASELGATFDWKPLDGEDWPCGAAFGDLNNDGRLDLVVTIHSVRARNRVYLNDSPSIDALRFRDVTEEAGIGDIVPARCPHVEIQDFDNDGRMDIYTSAAWMDDEGRITPLIYRNTGVRSSVPRFEPPQAIGSPMVYFPAGPSADYDGDGRVDLFLCNWFQGNHSRLLRNESSKRHWIDVRLACRQSNRMGLGSKVRVFEARKAGDARNLLGYQELSVGFGYASGQEAKCHFGLGDHDQVDLEIVFPNANRRQLRGVATNQVLVIEDS